MIVVRAVGIALVIAVLGAIPVAGFSLGAHEAILKGALDDGNTLNAEALKWITGSFAMGGGNLGSDRHQLSPEKHFDSAKNPMEICQLWERGLNAALKRAVELAAPVGIEKRKLDDRQGALEAFGEATHSLADFYSHTNWIELHELSHYQTPLAVPQAPILDQRCAPSAFSPRLHSGYFSLSHGTSGCPSAGPPAGFGSCHSQLAKDEPTSGHGKDKIGGGNITYHEAAVAVSIRATRSAWRVLHDRIVARYLTDATDGECVFTKLAWGGDRSCHRKWRADGEIKTHQEYAVPGARLLHDLHLPAFPITFQSQSVEYPGPRAAPVYADVRGTTRQRGTFCQTVIPKKGPVQRRCDPYKSDTIGSDDARVKVTPNSDPIELDWRVTFPGKKPKCSGPVIVRIDPGAPSRQPFLDCPGGMPGLRAIRLTYSGTFKVSPE